MLRNKIAILVGFIFFSLGFITLKDYNIMWDGRGHFLKGQSYANFFLTGNEDYDKPVSKEYVRYYRDYVSRSNPGYENSFYVPSDSYRKSIYKDPFNGFKKYKNDPGHPPFSDIGAAFFNIIFYEKLGLVKDDLSYGLFALFLSSILVTLIFAWVRKSYGFFPAAVSVLALSTYPLFWAESHFNIKDVPLMVFFSLSIWAFWKGIVGRSKKWILMSSIFAGFALGTKFNALFLLFIFIPWFVMFYLRQSKAIRKEYHRWWWILFIYPLIMFGILFAIHPYLWQDPIKNFFGTFLYYRGIGFDIDYTPQFRTIFGLNSYPAIWIAITAYPLVLSLSIVGIFVAVLKLIKKKDTLPMLFLFWFLIPILRVSIPKSAIYDGVRQIMEFIPAMAVLSGIGANFLIKQFNNKAIRQFVGVTIILLFIPFVITLIRLHPVENSYFNSFVGGLKGAKESNIAGWGNTDGGIYKVAVNWLNNNAEEKSHIATGFSEPADFYIPNLREDLFADNKFSGHLHEGEYIIALTHDTGLEHTYKMLYLNTFLIPVYEYKIDGVTLLKIWKNEKKYLKDKSYFKTAKIKFLPILEKNMLLWDLGENNRIFQLQIEFENKPDCKDLDSGYIQVSSDGDSWKVLPETYAGNSGEINILIAGVRARHIRFMFDPEDSCIQNVKKSFVLVQSFQ